MPRWISAVSAIRIRVEMKKYAGSLVPLLLSAHAIAQAPSKTCESTPQPAFCSAVRGARAEGWPAQSRSEVMAQHGMVATSQPLAAQAGLQILAARRQRHRCRGGDRGGAQCHRTDECGRGRRSVRHHLCRQGTQALCAERQRHGAHAARTSSASTSSAIARNPENWGPGSGMPAGRNSAGHGAGRGLGLAGGAQALRHADI